MPNKCPQCGTPIDSGALGGLCPACLLAQGAWEETATGGQTPPFNPPPIVELTPRFPQLEIIELIGKGGMGAVYQARQKQLDRFVALKILPPGIGHDAAFAERFAREARALARLNHPGIVTLYEFGETNGQFYFLMEFVDGVNLRQLLNAGRISTREALAIVPQICDALQFAHDHGIVHRDIKPENILLDRKGHVKVADFGLAKIIGGDSSDPVAGVSHADSASLTGAGKLMGTPQYMSPEQIKSPGEVDHRADIYALGVVFYQMLTGELPGKKIEPPSRKVLIDVRLDEIVMRALEKKPELRYQQASVLKTQVETIAATPDSRHPEPADQPPLFENQNQTNRRSIVFRSVLVGAVAWLLIFMLAAVVTSLLPGTYVGTVRIKMAGAGPFSSADPYQLMSEIERLNSYEFLQEVAAKAELKKHWKNFLTGTESQQADQMVNRLRSTMELRPVRNTPLIDINIYSQSAAEVADIANTIATTYCDQTKAQIVESARVPDRPARPNVFLNLAIGLVGGGFIGLIVGSIFYVTRKNPPTVTPGATPIENLPPQTSFWLNVLRFLRLVLGGFLLLSLLPLIFPPILLSSDHLILILMLTILLVVVVGAQKRLKVARAEVPQRRKNFFFVKLPAALVLALVVRMFFLQAFVAATDAAAPEIPRGSRFLVWKLAHNFAPGDLIAYRRGGYVNIGRVAQNQGASVTVNRNGEVDSLVLAPFILGKVIIIYWRTSRSGKTGSGNSGQSAIHDVKDPPFIARLDRGSVELLILASNPSTNSTGWLPNGAPIKELFPSGNGHSWAEGKTTRDVTFHIHSDVGTPSEPVIKFKDSDFGNMGSSLQWTDRGQTSMTFVQAITCPPEQKEAEFQVGVALGDWETRIVLKHEESGLNQEASESSQSDGDWSATYNAVVGKDQSVAVNCVYSKNADWEVRMVAVNKKGKIIPVPENSARTLLSPAVAMLLISTNQFADIVEFQLQRRAYQWVRFRHVSLQPENHTIVEIVDSQNSITNHEAIAQPEQIASAAIVEPQLLAVTRLVPKVSSWWLPDGTSTSQKFEIDGLDSQTNDSTVCLIFKMPHLQNHSSIFHKVIPESWNIVGTYSIIRQSGKQLYDCVAVLVKVPPIGATNALKQFAFQIGIASGVGTVLASGGIKGAGNIGTTLPDGNRIQLLTNEPIQGRDFVSITYSYDSLHGWDAYVVAVYSDGEEHQSLVTGSASDGLAQMEARFDGLKLASVKEFRFMVRPYHWVEFQNISLELGGQTKFEKIGLDRSFGATIETVVETSDWQTGYDLDTGRVMEAGDRQRHSGADLVVAPTATGNDLLYFVGTRAEHFPDGNVRWRMAESLVATNLALIPASRDAFTNEDGFSRTEAIMPEYSEHPDTYEFQTLQGNMGVLQILGTNANPRGIKIRYKLVKEGANIPATQGAPAAQPLSIIDPPQVLSSRQDVLNQRTNIEAPELVFGPVVVPTIYDQKSGKDWLLNLKTGETFSLPAGMDWKKDPRAVWQWMHQRGVQIVGYTVFSQHWHEGDPVPVIQTLDHPYGMPVASKRALYGFEMKAAIVEEAGVTFDNVTPLQISNLLQKTVSPAKGSYKTGPWLLQFATMAWHDATWHGLDDYLYAFQMEDGQSGVLQITGFAENPLGMRIRYKLVQPAGQVDIFNRSIVMSSRNGKLYSTNLITHQVWTDEKIEIPRGTNGWLVFTSSNTVFTGTRPDDMNPIPKPTNN